MVVFLISLQPFEFFVLKVLPQKSLSLSDLCRLRQRRWMRSTVGRGGDFRI